MKKTVLISSLLLCATFLSACGQRGPLYLPEKKSPVPQQNAPSKPNNNDKQDNK